ncbi:hypothetical protein [Stigmatella erecta]|uniref:Predicted metalloprotease, contains C-terminal PDZ domain n=1 Tax=Stigmatella erecta TaxID=83460 RepID=A0A1I0L4C5_9BACT|nr:hypothetical protein [Stigmatella erecta]SEU34191.1 Predicted metalloprotease, contains C-terminal PDZ domain [Stigmatella erecta]
MKNCLERPGCWVLLCLGVLACADARVRPVPPAAEGLALKYRLQVSPEAVRVELEIRGRAGERVSLQVPDSLGAGCGLRLVSDVEAWDGAGRRLPVLSPEGHSWECRLPHEGLVRLSYRVRTEAGAHGLAPNAPGAGEMPALDAHHVFLPGALVLLAPSSPDMVKGPISVEWQVPAGWRVLTPFGAEAPGLEVLLDNYLVAGTFSQVPVEVPGGLTLEVAWFGAGDVARSALPQILPRVLGGAVGLMGGRAPVGRYVLLLRPDFPSGLMQGTPRQGSLQVHLPREVPLERAHEGALLSTLAHEYLHTWGRDSKAELQLTSAPEPGGEMRWFIEGFVNYLAQLALLEGGAQDLTAFLSSLGRAYAAVERHPGYGQESLAQASTRFFEDPGARAFSYSGGMVVAFLCDLELRRQGKGTLAGFLGRVPPGRLPVDWKDWREAWTRHTGSPEPVASWIRTAAPLPFLDVVREAGGVVREQARWIFDVGFEVRPEGLTVASLGPLVGAQGLARGDVVVSVEGRAVSSVEAFLQALEPTGKSVTVQLMREGVPRELRLHRAFWKDYAVSADGPSVLGQWARPGR